MTKSELVAHLARRVPFPRKAAEATVDAIFATVTDALKRGERVEIRGFGNFTVRQYRPYTGRNPKTGERVHVPAKRMPFFRVGKDLHERLNDGA